MALGSRGGFAAEDAHPLRKGGFFFIQLSKIKITRGRFAAGRVYRNSPQTNHINAL